jgi:glycosyltransferase involved in cell wall biosynthesis
MKNTKPVSIIVPVYNVEKYLNQCIDSILGQTFADFELILIDDGSKDSSGAICDEYAKSDSRIRVIHQPNGGQTSARKAGFAASIGEYIYFIDSDDWMEPNLIEVAYNKAVENDADIVTFDSYFNYSFHQCPVSQPIESGVFDKIGLIEKIYPKMIYSGRFFYFGIYAAMWNKLFKRSLVENNFENVKNDIKIGEDGVLTFSAFLDANRVVIDGKNYLYHYRDNNSSLTRSYVKDQYESAKILINTLRQISDSKNVYDLNKQIDYYLMYNVRSIFIEEFYYRYKKSIFDRIKYLRTISSDENLSQIAETLLVDEIEKTPKMFIKNIAENNFGQLIVTSITIAMKMRLKVFVRKILKRY